MEDVVVASLVKDVPAENTSVGSNFTYHYLPPEEWPRVLSLLSYCSPGHEITLDPASQSIIAVETADGQIVSAAVISGVFHVAYLIPLAQEVNIVHMQQQVEMLLPSESTYYTMVNDGPEADVMKEELGMSRIEVGVVVFMKRNGEPSS